MKYSTKIEKTSDTLAEVAALAKQLDSERVLAAIAAKRLAHDDIEDYTLRLREKHSRMKREIASLRRFAVTFNREYATDDNSRFSTAGRLFGIIRSNMSETLKILKSFCPRVRGRLVENGVERQATVIDHSMLCSDVPVNQLIFGEEVFDDCVKEFHAELMQFFANLEDAVLMCQDVLLEESGIRNDAARCQELYERCCEEVLERSNEFLDYFGKEGFAREDSLSAALRGVPSLQEGVSGHFHRHNRNEFQLHVMHKVYHEGHNDDLTEIETYLWPNNHALAHRVRVVVEHFDELSPRGLRVGDTDRFRLSGRYVAVLMKWAEVKDTKKEKHFVERYFNTTYHGDYDTIASSTVNTAKNKLLRDEASEREIRQQIERLVEKYC